MFVGSIGSALPTLLAYVANEFIGLLRYIPDKNESADLFDTLRGIVEAGLTSRPRVYCPWGLGAARQNDKHHHPCSYHPGDPCSPRVPSQLVAIDQSWGSI